MLLRLSFALVLSGLALVAPAQAAAPWTAPAPLKSGSPAGLRGSPSITGNAAGLAVAVADTGGGLPAIGPKATASVFTNGVFLDPFKLAPTNHSYGPEVGGVAAYASTRLLASGLHYERNATQAIFAFGRLTPNAASLGTARTLGPGTMHAGPTALAVNSDGDAAMVYPVCRDAECTKALIYLAVRKAGSSTIHSVRLADGSGPLPRVAAAVNARGDALAVWTQSSRVYARVRTLGGKVRDRQTVGTTLRGTHLPPSAALSATREELIGWVSQTVSEGDGSSGTTSVAQADDGGAFKAVKLATLPAGTGHYVSEAGIRVAFDAADRRLLAWTGYNGAHFTVQAAELDGATLVDGQLVSNPRSDTVLGDAVTDASGKQLLAMVGGTEGNDAQYPSTPNTPILAALRSANATGAFSVEPVTDGTSYAFDAHAALLPGRAIIVWASTAGGGQAQFSQRVG